MVGAGAQAASRDAARDERKRVDLRRIQIDLNFKSVNRNAFSLPVWALLLNVFFSGLAPEIGSTPLSVSWIWVGACLVGSGVALLFKRRFQAACRAGVVDVDVWYPRVLALHIGIGVSWSLGIWLHWEPASAANHMFLFVVAIGCAALYGVVRAGDFNIPVAGTLPLFLSLWLHFLGQALWVDTVLAFIVPVWYAQFLRDTKNGCAVIERSHKTQIDLEELAADLALARDDAETQRAAAIRANASKSAFLANMSHELRTPLNAILGFAEIIESQALGASAQERYRDYAGDIHASGRHLLSLINDLLDIAKIEAGKLKLETEWLDGHALVAHAMKLVHERAQEKGVALRLSDETAPPRVFADERAFNQIALNLLSNAVKFTDNGHVAVSLTSAPGTAVLVVEDTGCGIARDHLERVFQSFEQVDNRYARGNGGTGLGLTLVRALAELHGGSCTIESQEGQGTRVEVRLPYPAETASSDGPLSKAA